MVKLHKNQRIRVQILMTNMLRGILLPPTTGRPWQRFLVPGHTHTFALDLHCQSLICASCECRTTRNMFERKPECRKSFETYLSQFERMARNKFQPCFRANSRTLSVCTTLNNLLLRKGFCTTLALCPTQQRRVRLYSTSISSTFS